MAINTASAAISFGKELEQEGAKFYEDLSQRYPQYKDTFMSMVRENRKYAAMVQDAYFSVISDAIEGCFAFDINPEEFKLQTRLSETTIYAEALSKAIEMEEKMVYFNTETAEQSKSLLGDMSRVFGLIVRKRNERIATLKSMG
jgi:rubrerythrin